MVVPTELIGIAGVERVRRHAPAALTSVLSETRSESGKNLLFLSEKGRRNMAFCRRNAQSDGFSEITFCGVKSNLHILY
jgi:hypothetical protein